MKKILPTAQATKTIVCGEEGGMDKFVKITSKAACNSRQVSQDPGMMPGMTVILHPVRVAKSGCGLAYMCSRMRLQGLEIAEWTISLHGCMWKLHFEVLPASTSLGQQRKTLQTPLLS